MRYKLVAGTTFADFTHACREAVSYGWKPQSSPFGQTNYWVQWFYQEEE